jgi:hypothetical protein
VAASKLKYFLYRALFQQVFDYVRITTDNGPKSALLRPHAQLINYAQWKIVTRIEPGPTERLRGICPSLDRTLAYPQLCTGASGASARSRRPFWNRSDAESGTGHGTPGVVFERSNRKQSQFRLEDYRKNWESRWWRRSATGSRVTRCPQAGASLRRTHLSARCLLRVREKILQPTRRNCRRDEHLNDMDQKRVEWNGGSAGYGLVSATRSCSSAATQPPSIHIGAVFGLRCLW